MSVNNNKKPNGASEDTLVVDRRQLLLVESKLVPYFASSQHFLGEDFSEGGVVKLKNIVKILELTAQNQVPNQPGQVQFVSTIQYVPDNLYGSEKPCEISEGNIARKRHLTDADAGIIKAYEGVLQTQRLNKAGLVAPPEPKLDQYPHSGARN